MTIKKHVGITDILFFLFFFSLFCWGIFDAITNKEPRTNVNYQALQQQQKQLMINIVSDIPFPDKIEPYSRPSGYTKLSYYYNNPTQTLIDSVITNIEKQNVWQEVAPLKVDDKYIFKSYCYNELGLNLLEYHNKLEIYIYWSNSSFCHINANKPIKIPSSM